MARVVKSLTSLEVTDELSFPLTIPLCVEWVFSLQVTKSIHTYEYKHTRPDGDGYLKTTKDCLQEKKLFKLQNGTYQMGAGIIQDDSIIVKETTIKAYGPTTGIGIRIAPAGEYQHPSWID